MDKKNFDRIKKDEKEIWPLERGLFLKSRLQNLPASLTCKESCLTLRLHSFLIKKSFDINRIRVKTPRNRGMLET